MTSAASRIWGINEDLLDIDISFMTFSEGIRREGFSRFTIKYSSHAYNTALYETQLQ